MANGAEQKHESTLGAILGWGSLAVFSIAFGWYVGAPLIIGEHWADKKTDAIQLVRNYKPNGTETLYDMIRGFSLKQHGAGVYVGEFNWDGIQRDGPEYEVTLLWTEGSEHKAAVWRVNLKTGEIRPQGNEAASLPQRIGAGSLPKS